MYKWLSHKHAALMNGISAFMKEIEKITLGPSTPSALHCEDSVYSLQKMQQQDTVFEADSMPL